MLTFEERQELKDTITKALRLVDSFTIEFTGPASVSTFSNVKPGAKRHFRRKAGTSYFTQGSNSKIVVSAATVTSIVAENSGKLVLPEEGEKKSTKKKLDDKGPTAQ